MKKSIPSEACADSSESTREAEQTTLVSDNSPARSIPPASKTSIRNSVSPRNPARRVRRQHGFKGRGLEVSWERGTDHQKSVFLTGIDTLSCEDENEFSNRRTGSVVNSTSGNGIKDKNVFVLEIVKDRHIRIAIAIIYLSFLSLLTFDNLYFARIQTETFQLAVLPENATGDTLVCYPQSDGTCEPYEELNVGQAALLANTVVVSDGINATDWEDDGAKAGSPAFTANNISNASFIADPSVLEYGADSDLQSFWDDITAVIWTGHAVDGVLINYRSITISFQFEKIDGGWPANITDDSFPVQIDSFSCVKGGKSYCESVGNWREIMKYENNPQAPQQLSGKTLKTKVIFYNYYVDDDLVERDAWRFVVRADPDGAVTDCINGNNCIASIVIEGRAPHDLYRAWLFLSFFIFYLGFFILWISLLKKRRGPPSFWPHENWWLVVASIGFMLQMNILHTGLTLSMIYSESFTFSQSIWTAAVIITRAGYFILTFAGACFIDAPRKYVTTNLDFCKYKITFLFGYFAATIVPVFFYFPQTIGIDEPGTDSHLGGVGYGSSPIIWQIEYQNVTLAAVIVMMVLGLLAFFYYVWKSFVGFRLLDSLPYGMTRHTQLSFRFFFWATSLWTIVILSMVIHRMVDISSETIHSYYDDTFRGTVLSLDKAATIEAFRNIASIIYLCVIITIHQLMFLPPSLHGLATNSIKYHNSEIDELCYNASRLQQQTKHLLILDKALLLCICSKEAYLPFDNEELAQRMNLNIQNDEEETTDQSSTTNLELHEEGTECEMKSTGESLSEIPEIINSGTEPSPSLNPSNNLDDKVNQIRIAGEVCDESVSGSEAARNSSWAAGCRVVSRICERGGIDIHDTRVIIFRHEFSNDLIVAFRGTATAKQAKTDLMMSQVTVCLDTFLMIPSRTEKIKMKTIHSGYVGASRMENKLISGEINKVRLLDLMPKVTDKLPSYLRDAEKAVDKISGKGRIHFGFWSSYNRVRRELHETIREELIARPGRLILTGHSLGGSQATLCAYDMCRWVLPTAKHHLRGNREMYGKIKLSCYTFGSPKCGGSKFVAAYNKVVRDSQRIVCDGDLITSGPYAIMNYFHVRRENIFDFTGTVRVEPPVIEKKFSLKTRNKTSSHKMDNYLKVIRKSFDPEISEEVLLDRVREAYGYKKKNEENQDHESSTNIDR